MEKKLAILAILTFISLAYAGGAVFDCWACHRSDMGSLPFPLINETLFGVHANVNSTDGAGTVSALDCIECHYTINSYPHISPESIYTCEDCHVNGTLATAPRVYNHNRSSNISVSAACGACHNKTSNLFRYNANASAAHYGRNASFGLTPGGQYCAYCHSNSSTIYRDVMTNQNNNMLGNHTSGVFSGHPAGGTPVCTTCHWTDTIHGTNLTKPVLNSSFCNDCHNKDTLKKDMHAGQVECQSCHAEVDSDIHNIKYLLPDGSYRSINATGCSCHDSPWIPIKPPFSTANCTTCHLGSGVARFQNVPRFPSPMTHSSNPVSGGLWNGTQASYWSDQVSACKYCHGDNLLHNTTPLGKVSNIQSGNALNQSITNESYWCANCHYQGGVPSGNYSYNATAYDPQAPEIQNSSGLVPSQASDGISFYNHSLAGYSDASCILCHSANSPATSALFIHGVGPGGGGPNCISCHDISGGSAPADKRIDIGSFNTSVHYGINGGGNMACWACHGDGTEPSGHPAEYKSPKKCSSDECHSLNQKFRAPMIYSHFRNANLNNNPSDAVNSNVTTKNDCQECHVNSVNSQGRNINSTVSHFASNALFDSINCIYCHINEDNSEKWGNATLIDRNRTTLYELNKEDNKFIAREGDTVDLGSNFRLKVIEISSVRESALIELLKENVPVDKSLIGIGNYTYEEYLDIDNVSVKVPVIVINVTGIFKGSDTGFIQFEGFRLRRVHPEKKTTSCYSCHINARPKTKFKVIERVSNDEKDDIYYTVETANFSDRNIFDETSVLRLLEQLTDEELHVNIDTKKRKTLYEGQIWNISEGTSLKINGVNSESDLVVLDLRTGDYSYEDIIGKGGIFEFSTKINYLGNQPKNITLFRAKVTGIIQASPKNMAIIEDVYSLSPDIMKIKSNESIDGYNTSWLWENSTINVGKIPEDLHSPQLFDGGNGGGNCLSCHGRDSFTEKKVISLGKHDTLNGGGNFACRACHGGTEDMESHPAGYRTPRSCKNCHAATLNNYGALNIGDEEHRNEKCETCHVSNIHEITGLHMTPSVKNISLTKEGNRTILRATASAGYKMKVRGARYYIDLLPEKIKMSPADGIFDTQIENIFTEINVSELSPGKHIVYVEAMERNDKWGLPASLEFTIEGGKIIPVETRNASMPALVDVIAVLLIAFIFRHELEHGLRGWR